MAKKKDSQKTLHAVIVLDRSSSMEVAREQTVSGINEQLKTLRLSVANEPNLQVKVSLISFADHALVHFWDRAIEDTKDLAYADYVPNGMTAMYDGVGLALDSIHAQERKEDSYLLCIISDGQENHSRIWNRQTVSYAMQAIAKLENWTVAYIGANQDLSIIQNDWHVPASNTLLYQNDKVGTQSMFRSMSASVGVYAASVSAGATNSKEMFENRTNTKEPIGLET